MTNSTICPVCENLCSSLAVSCPKCGHPFAPKEELPIKSDKSSKGLNKWMLLTIITGVILLGIVAFAFYNQNSKTGGKEGVKTEAKANQPVSQQDNSSLEFQAAIDYKVGGVQPVTNTTFYLLDKSAEETIRTAGIKPHTEEFEKMVDVMKKRGNQSDTVTSLFWLKLALKDKTHMFGDYAPLLMAEIKKNSIKSTNTDLQGKAKFEGLQQKRYYIFSLTETRGGVCIWDLPVDIKGEKQSIILDQSNAVEID